MPDVDLALVLREAHAADPGSVPDVIGRAAARLGGNDVVVYLIDFGQTSLEPMPGRGTHASLPESQEIAATIAGRAFLEGRVMTADRPDGVRVWAPIVEGSDRTGVLALTLPEAPAMVLRTCEALGLLTGYLIAAEARTTDLFNLYRRRKSLSLAASMQWDLLPPLILKTSRVAVAGVLEPAYDVGGDSFDYALNDSTLEVAILDAVGHGLASAMIAALAIGSYRHDRREGRSLEQMHRSIDEAIAAQIPGTGFATGQLARLDLDSGELTLTNAGHPVPLLLRNGRLVGELACPPTVPWGLMGVVPTGAAPTVATHRLEPGDVVILYTDGMVEARVPGGERFGVERLVDIAGQHASELVEPEEIARRLVRSVLDHQQEGLADDATIVLVRWNGSSP